MSGQHCENYDVKRETVYCYPRNGDRCCTWSLEDRWNPSAVFKFCFCFVLLHHKSLNYWSLGAQWILFASNLNVSLGFVSGNKIHCSLRDQSLSVYYKRLSEPVGNRMRQSATAINSHMTTTWLWHHYSIRQFVLRRTQKFASGKIAGIERKSFTRQNSSDSKVSGFKVPKRSVFA